MLKKSPMYTRVVVIRRYAKKPSYIIILWCYAYTKPATTGYTRYLEDRHRFRKPFLAIDNNSFRSRVSPARRAAVVFRLRACIYSTRCAYTSCAHQLYNMHTPGIRHVANYNTTRVSCAYSVEKRVNAVPRCAYIGRRPNDRL